MTKQELESLNLGLTLDEMTVLTLSAGIEWLEANTTINTADIEHFPNCAKLFLIKFCDLQNMETGITSESLGGMSQSFEAGDKSALLWQLAESLLGGYLKGQVRFVAAVNRWR